MDDRRMMTAPTFLEIMARRQPHLVPVDEQLTALRRRDERPPFRDRLWAATEALSALDETVGSTRDQLMQYLLSVLHSEILRPTIRLSERQLGTVMLTLSGLDHEPTRPVPDVARFGQGARLVVDIMLLA
jgi:hypothetical protein